MSKGFFTWRRTVPADKNILLAVEQLNKDYAVDKERLLATLRVHMLRFEMNKATVDDLVACVHHWYPHLLKSK